MSRKTSNAEMNCSNSRACEMSLFRSASICRTSRKMVEHIDTPHLLAGDTRNEADTSVAGDVQ